MKEKVNIFWFRRDLRFEDNVGLFYAIQSALPVVPMFIFDKLILDELPKNDARVQFIYETLFALHMELQKNGSSLRIEHGKPLEVWGKLASEFEISEVFTNEDYEPYAISRDKEVTDFLEMQHIKWNAFKDQVIFHKNDIVKSDGKPYTVFTPYKRKWLETYRSNPQNPYPNPDFSKFYKAHFPFISLHQLGFEPSEIKVKPFTLVYLERYEQIRNFPALDQTSYFSVHLRFGTIGIRYAVENVKDKSETFLSELIWRSFFKQIIFHFPNVVYDCFYPKYNVIKWRNNEAEFEKWCHGKTGYPMVDAGMRELNQTGYMHNRVRMVVASFLTKHLLIDWRWGEAYFAQKLLDYDLSANNGNWQWAAGTGCDASPYFRIFNPSEQLKKFDKDLEYVKKWIPELLTPDYPQPIVEHTMARTRALETYKHALKI